MQQVFIHRNKFQKYDSLMSLFIQIQEFNISLDFYRKSHLSTIHILVKMLAKDWKLLPVTLYISRT